MPLPVSLQSNVQETSAAIPYWWRITSQISVVRLIGGSEFPTQRDQSEALRRSGLWCIISMEFMRSFLKRHAGKPVVACLLKLNFIPRFEGAVSFIYFILGKRSRCFLFHIANKTRLSYVKLDNINIVVLCEDFIFPITQLKHLRIKI